MKQPSRNLTHHAALNLLTRRDHSQLELIQKLANKNHPHEMIQTTIKSLKQTGFINDRRFAENYCQSRRQRGFGPLRIKAELEGRGIDLETIAEVIKITDNDWFIAAQRVWQKRFKKLKPDDMAARAKQMRFLQYRGFTREHINYVFK